jgi:hypothetical protein
MICGAQIRERGISSFQIQNVLGSQQCDTVNNSFSSFDRAVSVAKKILRYLKTLRLKGKFSLGQWQSAGSRSLVLKHLFNRNLHRITERGWIVAALKGENHGHRPAGKNAFDNGTDAFMRDTDVGMTVIDMDIIAR